MLALAGRRNVLLLATGQALMLSAVVLAMTLLLGRYTGYRLSELYRFNDLIREETAPGGTHVVVGKVAQASGNGGPGDEPPQRGVHPRPESAEPVPAGGRQAAAGCGLSAGPWPNL